MPIAAVGAAIGAIGMAAAVPSTFAIIGAVGATVGAIGAVTGSKALSIAGGALGAVGGIGALADSAGVFGSGGLFGSTSTGAVEAGTAGASVSDSAASIGAAPVTSAASPYADVGALMNAQGIGTSTDVISSISGTTAPSGVLQAAAPAPEAMPVNQAGGLIEQGGGEGGTLGTQNNPAATGMINTGSTPSPATAGTTPAAPTPPEPPPVPGSGATPTAAESNASGFPAGGGPKGPTGGAVAAPSFWGNMLSWIEGHPTLALGGISAAGSFLSGAFNPKTPAEVNALNAQAAKNQADIGLINAQTQITSQQASNMQQPVPGATRTRTNTGTQGMNTPGLINRPVMV